MTLHAIEQMMATNPNRPSTDARSLADCIEACLVGQLACTSCSDACLGDAHVEDLRRCIRATIDCADVCGTTGRMLARLRDSDDTLLRSQLATCVLACARCYAECDMHSAHHAHAATCSDACRRCEEMCRIVSRQLTNA